VVLALSFFIGVVLSITALGVAASFVGRLLADWSVGFAVATAVLSLRNFGGAFRRRTSESVAVCRVRFSTASRTRWRR
jgi:cytochrome c biogenesis protein CcdA